MTDCLSFNVACLIAVLPVAAACGGTETPVDSPLDASNASSPSDAGDSGPKRESGSQGGTRLDAATGGVADSGAVGGEGPSRSDTGTGDGPAPVADVLKVVVSGSPGDYSFEVSVRSPDTGCDQYADWWEVVGLDGSLVYRRILLHSHVTEQPFSRTGGPVPIQADTTVWVRAHLSAKARDAGYGGRAVRGTPNEGFIAAEPDLDDAALERASPTPEDCLY